MEDESVNKIPADIFWPPGQRELIELDRLKKTKYYQIAESVYVNFAYDKKHGVLGWWNADDRAWFEIWAIRTEHLGPMSRWSYFPKTYEGEPIGLPSDIDLKRDPPDIVSPLEAPYNVLKRVAMRAEKELE